MWKTTDMISPAGRLHRFLFPKNGIRTPHMRKRSKNDRFIWAFAAPTQKYARRVENENDLQN